MSCAGVSLSTGDPCHARGKHMWHGRLYCVGHFAVAAREGSRFQQAVERQIRREAKGRIRRQADARQLDAFSDPDLHPSPEVSVDCTVNL